MEADTLIQQKEQEIRDINKARVTALEDKIEHLQQEERQNFQQLSEAFEYNLGLLSERDEDLDKLHTTYEISMKLIQERKEECEELKVLLGDTEAKLRYEENRMSQLQIHYTEKINNLLNQSETLNFKRDEEYRKQLEVSEVKRNHVELQLQEKKEELLRIRQQMTREFEDSLRSRESHHKSTVEELTKMIHQLELRCKEQSHIINDMETKRFNTDDALSRAQTRESERRSRQLQYRIDDMDKTFKLRESEMMSRIHLLEEQTSLLKEEHIMEIHRLTSEAETIERNHKHHDEQRAKWYESREREERNRNDNTIKMLQSKLESTETRFTSAEEQLESLKNENERLVWEMEERKGMMEERERDHESKTRQMITDLDLEITQLREGIHVRDEEIHHLKEKNMQYKVNHEERKNEMEVMKHEMEVMKSKLLESEKRLQQTRTDHERWQAVYTERNLSNNQEVMSKVTKQRDDLRILAEDLQTELERSKALVEKREKEMIELQQNLTTLQKKYQLRKQANRQMRIKYERSNETLTKENTELQSKHQNLEETLKETTGQNERMRHVIGEMRQTMEQVQKKKEEELKDHSMDQKIRDIRPHVSPSENHSLLASKPFISSLLQKANSSQSSVSASTDISSIKSGNMDRFAINLDSHVPTRDEGSMMEKSRPEQPNMREAERRASLIQERKMLSQKILQRNKTAINWSFDCLTKRQHLDLYKREFAPEYSCDQGNAAMNLNTGLILVLLNLCTWDKKVHTVDIHSPVLDASSTSDRSSVEDETEEEEEEEIQLSKPRRSHYRNLFLCFRSERPRMPPSVMLSGSWWIKWSQYGRFPWKLVIQVLLIVASTSVVLLQNTRITYLLSNTNTFYKAFWPPGSHKEVAGTFGSHTFLHDINETKYFVHHVVHQYYRWPAESIEGYFYCCDPDSQPQPLRMEVALWGSLVDDSHTQQDTYSITPTDLGPLNGNHTELKDFFVRLQHIKIYIELYSYESVNRKSKLHKWNMEITLTEYAGAISTVLEIQWDNIVRTSRGDWDERRFIMAILFIFTFLLAIIKLILSFTSVRRSFSVMQKLKKKSGIGLALSSRFLVWEQVPLRYKLRFFNIWFLVSFFSCACLIVGAVLGLLRSTGITNQPIKIAYYLLMGVGTMLSWAGLTRYLAFDEKYMVLISALARGVPNVARFLISAAPIFIGYIIFSVMYFSETSVRFATFEEAAVTLFGLQNGDDIQATFRTILSSPIVGPVFIVSFIFLGVYAVANIFISIMQDAYLASKEAWSNVQMSASGAINAEDEIQPNDEVFWDNLLAAVESRRGSMNEHTPLISRRDSDASNPSSVSVPIITVTPDGGNGKMLGSELSTPTRRVSSEGEELRKMMELVVEEEQIKFKKRLGRRLDEIVKRFEEKNNRG
ncbi:hypothetical protein PROFUN_01604 [Planoprotostelium fungivorum]|uniref:Polycystin cation channel PKD1/PKD2 domain-containing protein n=1 Tax=Planoprotostelium fungivorum TaxID=1890364 RepID=A0A2P6NTQ7_9EUKA|nr:hypothetical protein PROFUN_01604 [Planoprotostelium fungivorum]